MKEITHKEQMDQWLAEKDAEMRDSFRRESFQIQLGRTKSFLKGFGIGVLLLAVVWFMCGCAATSYSRTNMDGSKTVYSQTSLFSTTGIKGTLVDGNGTAGGSPGLHVVGSTTDPNVAAINAVLQAVVTLAPLMAGHQAAPTNSVTTTTSTTTISR